MPKKPKSEAAKKRKKKPSLSFQFAGRKDGVMKLFKTEEKAFEYAEPNSTVAKYSTVNGTDFDFVGVVGIKTSANRIGKLLESL
jgi:hypothetical protein